MKTIIAINQITGQRCNLGKFTPATVAVLVSNLKFYTKTGRYENRKNPFVYQLGTTQPAAGIRENLGITTTHRQLFKLNIETDESVECGWILPSNVGQILRGFRLVTVNRNTWYEKIYDRMVYEVS
jgi:hypothetical protein